MRGPVAAFTLAAALLAACAPTTERGATGRGAQRAASSIGDVDQAVPPIEPETQKSTFWELEPGEELVVALPGADKDAGSIVFRQGEREALIDQPFAAARIRADGTVEFASLHAGVVSREFGAALSALPPRPAVFVLYFSEAKNRFTEGSLARLDEVFAAIEKRPAPEISIIGHTDTTGSASLNDKLSLARAKRARDELVRRGIPAERIVDVAGRGEREPLIPTTDGVSEPRNRRVEIGVR